MMASKESVVGRDDSATIEVSVAYLTRLEGQLSSTRAELARKREQVRTLTVLVEVFRLVWGFYYDHSKTLEAADASTVSPVSPAPELSPLPLRCLFDVFSPQAIPTMNTLQVDLQYLLALVGLALVAGLYVKFALNDNNGAGQPQRSPTPSESARSGTGATAPYPVRDPSTHEVVSGLQKYIEFLEKLAAHAELPMCAVLD
ncbi:hypothetical protein FKP32DRAFT_1682156 [Trametes sanguinea]|nr:hypothetical protein FKP32DRAFT_1682156 [Trametes sanguinea]